MIQLVKTLALGSLVAVAAVLGLPRVAGREAPREATAVERAAAAVGAGVPGPASETLPEALESSLFVLEAFLPERSARTLDDLADALERAPVTTVRGTRLDELALAWSRARAEAAR